MTDKNTETQTTTYLLRDEGGAEEEMTCLPHEVEQAWHAWVSAHGGAEEQEGTIWIHGDVLDEEGAVVHTLTHAIDPIEPACADGEEHAWHDDESVVGGGVRGHGGGVILTEHCAHCGVYRVTDTWAQDRQTGEEGLRSISYEPADKDSLAYVRGPGQGVAEG